MKLFIKLGLIIFKYRNFHYSWSKCALSWTNQAAVLNSNKLSKTLKISNKAVNVESWSWFMQPRTSSLRMLISNLICRCVSRSDFAISSALPSWTRQISLSHSDKRHIKWQFLLFFPTKKMHLSIKNNKYISTYVKFFSLGGGFLMQILKKWSHQGNLNSLWEGTKKMWRYLQRNFPCFLLLRFPKVFSFKPLKNLRILCRYSAFWFWLKVRLWNEVSLFFWNKFRTPKRVFAKMLICPT